MSVLEIYENLTYEVAVSIGGFDASPYFTGFSFRESLGGKATGTLTLVDKDANNLLVRPGRFGPDGGSNVLHPHALSAANPVYVTVTAAGMPSDYPAFLIADVEHKDGQTVVTLEDYHALLEQDGYNGGDILAEAGDRETAHSLTEAMCSDVSIPVTIGYTDFDVNEFRRSQTSRLACIQRLGKHEQAYTQFRGGQLYVEPPRYTGSDFSLAELNTTVLSFRETTAGHKNRFRASRLQPGVNRIVGQARGDSYGRNSQTTATIDPPCRVIQCFQKTIEKCVLGDFVAFDEADNPVATSGTGTFVSAYPIARVEFTAFPVSSAFDLSTVDMQFHCYFTGATGQPTNFDTEFDAVYNLTAEQGYYGIREEYTIIEDAAWPTKAIALSAITNMAIENADQRLICNVASWLNPRIRAGKRIALTDWEYRQAGSSWNVRDVQHEITHTTATMSLGCSRRRS